MGKNTAVDHVGGGSTCASMSRKEPEEKYNILSIIGDN